MSGRTFRKPARVAMAILLPVLLLATPYSASAAGQPAVWGDSEGQGRVERVAYFIQWGIYGRQFFVKDVVNSGAAQRLTTLNYAFGNVSDKLTCSSFDPWADFQRPVSAGESVDGVADVAGQALAGNFNQLRKLKAAFPKLRVLISLGGFTGSGHFSDAALTSGSREALVASCIDLFIKGNLPGAPGAAATVFDGFDIDWEWPGSAGADGNIVRPQDKLNFTLLLAEFRRQLSGLSGDTHRRYALTAFLPADPAKVRAGFEVPRIFHFLDFATLQGYDLHGPWERITNHQAALFSPPGDPTTPVKFSDALTVRTYLSLDAPAHKLVLGVPFYSHGWMGVPNLNHGLFQTSSGPAPSRFDPPGGPYSGTEDYKIVAAKPGFQLFRDSRDGTAWVYNASTMIFWTFDDPTAIAQKMRFIRSRHLGGAMAWELSGDDANGSLMKAMDSGLQDPDQEGD